MVLMAPDLCILRSGNFRDPSSWGSVTQTRSAPLCQFQSCQAYAQCWDAADPAWFQSLVADSSAPSLSVPILEWTSGPPPVSGKMKKSQGLTTLLKHSPQSSRTQALDCWSKFSYSPFPQYPGLIQASSTLALGENSLCQTDPFGGFWERCSDLGNKLWVKI